MTTFEDLGNGIGVEERIANLIKNLSDDKKHQLLDVLVEWQQKEQRHDQRIECMISVDFSNSKRVYKDFIQDLSKGGVFIETRTASLEVGEELSLTFDMPNSHVHFKVAGKIVRVDSGGIGVQFDNKLSTYQEQIIKKSFDPKK